MFGGVGKVEALDCDSDAPLLHERLRSLSEYIVFRICMLLYR